MIDSPEKTHHALVVGASSGLGFRVAEKLAKLGPVTALARRTEKMAPLADIGITPMACDVSDLDSIASIVQLAVAERGKIDKLVYCAGLQSIKPMRGLKVDDINMVVTVNLTAAICFGRLFASPKFSTGDAVFCAVSSIAAQRPEPAIIPYAAAKAGLDALIKGMARECAPRRAFGVAPGWLESEMTQAFPRVYNDAFKERLEKESPSGIATIETVSEMMVHLLSDNARHLTGQIVTIDGGASL